MITYNPSIYNENRTILERITELEKYMKEKKINNCYVSKYTITSNVIPVANIRVNDSSEIGVNDLLLDYSNGNLYLITGVNNDNTITIDYTNKIQFTITGPRGPQGFKGDTGNTGATGATGNGIASITKTATVGLVDTYTITYTNGTTTTYNVINGVNGATGAPGNGIASISKTASVGLVDTYTITYTDGTTTTYTVTNGAQGGGSNLNLLINSNLIINQRGNATYNSASTKKYTCDRFYFSGATGNTYTHATKTVTFGSSGGIFAQDIENYNDLKGQTVTLTVKISSITSPKTRLYGYDGVNTQLLDITSANTYTKTFTVDANATQLTVGLNTENDFAGDVSIEYFKLELGAQATEYTPPLMAEELLKCQRYYIDFAYVSTNNTAMLATGVCYSNTLAYLTLSRPVMMQNGTLISDYTKLETITTSVNNISNITNYSTATMTHGVRVTGTFTAGEAVVLRYKTIELRVLAIDAEMY